ncbi:MAG: hypothetical protein QI223_08060 [Candidatus Korarchaeota archaeon]|nr:hypothetical protein [Candidatus Korarchaeota archaeon]
MSASAFLAALVMLVAEEVIRTILEDFMDYYPLMLLIMAGLRVSGLARVEEVMEKKIDVWLERIRRSTISAARRQSMAGKGAVKSFALARRLRKLSGLTELDFTLPPIVRMG